MGRALLIALLALAALTHGAEDPVRFKRLEPPHGLRAKVKIVVPLLGSSPAQRAASRAIERRCNELLRDFVQAVREIEALRRTDPTIPEYPFELTIEPTVSLNSARRVSVLLTVVQYAGGAHPNTYHEGFVFGADGKSLALKDLLRPGVSEQDFVAAILLPELNEVKRARGSGPVQSLGPAELSCFVATPAGISWVFSPYAVGSYAEGTFVVKIPWEKLEGVLRSPNPLR